jgi:hypothetical protein
MFMAQLAPVFVNDWTLVPFFVHSQLSADALSTYWQVSPYVLPSLQLPVQLHE